MPSINTSSGAQPGTNSGAAEGPNKQPGTIAATSSEKHPAIWGQAGSAAAVADTPPEKEILRCRHASKRGAMGSVHFAAEVVERASHQDKSSAQPRSGIAEQDEQQQQQHLPIEPVGEDASQQQCKSNASSLGHQQLRNSSKTADHTQHDRPTGPPKIQDARPAMRADGNASSNKAVLKGSSNATEIISAAAALKPRYIGSFIADLDAQLIINHRNKQRKGFTFRSKGPEVALEGSPYSSAAAAVGNARVGKLISKP